MRRRRWLRWIGGGLAGAVAALGILVWWSIGQHEQLMLDLADSKSDLKKTALFTRDSLGGKFVYYRAPSIVATENGTILSFAEGRDGSKGDRGQTELVQRRSDDGGKTWSEPEIIIAEKDQVTGNPTVVFDRDKHTLWLAFHRQDTKGHGNAILIVSSDDDGRSWSEPINLSRKAKRPPELRDEGYIMTSPGHGIQQTAGEHDGRLILPTYAGRDSAKKVAKGFRGKAQALYSDDHGDSWHFGSTADYGGENQIAELARGELLMIIRTRAQSGSERMKRFARSRDGGTSWEPSVVSSEIVEPVCQASLLRHPSGGAGGSPVMLLASPSVQATGRWDKSSRRDLKIWVSSDEGKTWPISRLLHPGGASYSDLTIDRMGRVYVVFERGTKGKVWGGAVSTASFHMSWLSEDMGPPPPEPLSEEIYSLYRHVRGPLEEIWHDL